MICTLCPRRCGAERTEEEGRGFCGMPAGIRVARAALHMWEEPPISGTHGSGTVFFSGCTLRCAYCQNGSISAGGYGKAITTAHLREIFETLIAQGAHNINLVTPTHFLPWILPALEPKLSVPVVYNCGGYESVDTLRQLEGKVDIYLPDPEIRRRRTGGHAVRRAGLLPRGQVGHPGDGAPDRPLCAGKRPAEAGRGDPPSGAAGAHGQHPPLHRLGGGDVPAR